MDSILFLQKNGATAKPILKFSTLRSKTPTNGWGLSKRRGHTELYSLASITTDFVFGRPRRRITVLLNLLIREVKATWLKKCLTVAKNMELSLEYISRLGIGITRLTVLIDTTTYTASNLKNFWPDTVRYSAYGWTALAGLIWTESLSKCMIGIDTFRQFAGLLPMRVFPIAVPTYVG